MTPARPACHHNMKGRLSVCWTIPMVLTLHGYVLIVLSTDEARGSNVCGRGRACRMPVLLLPYGVDVWLRGSFRRARHAATRTAYSALRQRAHEDAWPNPPRLALLAHPHSVTDGPSISGRRVVLKVVARQGSLASWARWLRPSFRSASSHPASGRPSSRYRTSRAYQRLPLPTSAAT